MDVDNPEAEFDLTGELAIIAVFVISGLLALPFSTYLAMGLCFGGLTVYAAWLAFFPPLPKGPKHG